MPSQAAPPPQQQQPPQTPQQQAPAPPPQTPAKQIGRLGLPINQDVINKQMSLRRCAGPRKNQGWRCVLEGFGAAPGSWDARLAGAIRAPGVRRCRFPLLHCRHCRSPRPISPPLRSVTVKQINDAAAAQPPLGNQEYPLLYGEPLSNVRGLQGGQGEGVCISRLAHRSPSCATRAAAGSLPPAALPAHRSAPSATRARAVHAGGQAPAQERGRAVVDGRGARPGATGCGRLMPCSRARPGRPPSGSHLARARCRLAPGHHRRRHRPHRAA